MDRCADLRGNLLKPYAVRGPLLAVLLLPIFGPAVLPLAAAGQAGIESSARASANSVIGYVGSQTCSECHLEIYQRYSRTSMGRSMSPVTPGFIDRTASSPHVEERLNRSLEVYARDGSLYQSEAGVGPDGKESFREARQAEWIVGAGINGFGAILRRDGYLFQAPESFYSRTKSWGPSPGYEFADLGFNRPITAGCIFCHSGRPKPMIGSNGRFENPPFSEVAIGCENCHGPGAAHVKAMSDPNGNVAKKSSLEGAGIVNPARLTPYLADNICMACHQTGDARVLKPGKTYQDIRPGRPLDEVLSILLVPPTKESPPTADHVEHYYSMTLSKCYRASRGRLSCITCHDPHVEPSADEAPKYYADKCLTCHTNQSCKLPLESRMQAKPANNCIGCHMPRRDIQIISHSSATNHRIVAQPDEPFPDIAFRQTTTSLRDLIHLNPAPGQESAPLPLLTLLTAYGELAENKPEYVEPYLKVLGRLEKTQPDEALVQSALGRRDLKNGDYQAAAGHLRRAIELDPTVATTYADLADVLGHIGQTDEARITISKAVELDPFNPVARKMLIVDLIQSKQYAKAHEALENYLEVFPQDDFMRQMLARAEGKNSQR